MRGFWMRFYLNVILSVFYFFNHGAFGLPKASTRFEFQSHPNDITPIGANSCSHTRFLSEKHCAAPSGLNEVTVSGLCFFWGVAAAIVFLLELVHRSHTVRVDGIHKCNRPVGRYAQHLNLNLCIHLY